MECVLGDGPDRLLGTLSGADLMENGIELTASGVSHSHVLIFHARGVDVMRRRR